MTPDTHGGMNRADSLAMLVARQVEAIDAWNLAREQREALQNAPQALTREARLDAARRLDVLRRVQQAMLTRTAEFLARQPEPFMWPLPRRAVVAHRQAWFINQLTAALREHAITVVAATDNGADALGFSVAEQPDLLFVEDKLAMLSGLELTAEARIFAAQTLVAAQARDNNDVARMLDAGARHAFARQVPPADIADALAEMVSGTAAA
jgi:CheY-like chemotaxis protein